MVTRKIIETNKEKMLLIGMITNTEFLKQIAPVIKIHLLKIPYSRTIGNWVLDFWNKYEKAPGNEIQTIYQSKIEELEEKEAEIVFNFLSQLSETHFNTDYHVDESIQYLKLRNIEHLREQLTDITDPAKGEHIVQNFRRVEKISGEALDIMDPHAIELLFAQEENLFTMPGVLGELLTPMTREDLIAVVAPSKRGKTWWLAELGIKAYFNKLNVLFVSLEMNQQQIVKRIFSALTSEPLKEGTFTLPFFTPENEIDYRPIEKKGLFVNLESKLKRFKNLTPGNFKIISFPAYSLSIASLKVHLENMEYYENFIPDVIVVDYADILAPEFITKDPRHNIDSVWKSLRALAQEKKALVITASHSNKSTFTKNIGQDDLAEDYRKMNHVSLMFGLNQTPDEKENGHIRVSILASRHGYFNEQNEVLVLQNLGIGRPYLDSRWLKNVKREEKK